MELFGVIENLKYRKFLTTELYTISIKTISEVDINKLPPTYLLNVCNASFALSKWVSPKRTRSYPYARVYDTINTGATKVVTIIPIVKDEGAKGDRDYLQWDTVSLMSLLNVYVIPAYYCDAERSRKAEKITNQKFDRDYLNNKLQELMDYHASALHWNLKELSRDNFETLMERAIECYERIELKTGVKMHAQEGLKNIKKKIEKGAYEFRNFSRIKAKEAQKRESMTYQPKEKTIANIKGKLTIRNYLGGYYYFTVDDVVLEENILYLIESKHSKSSPFPSYDDIKDGLLKMILYTNLSSLEVNGSKVKFKPVLRLTSSQIEGNYKMDDIVFFVSRFGNKSMNFFRKLVEEAKFNGFEVWLEGEK